VTINILSYNYNRIFTHALRFCYDYQSTTLQAMRPAINQHSQGAGLLYPIQSPCTVSLLQICEVKYRPFSTYTLRHWNTGPVFKHNSIVLVVVVYDLPSVYSERSIRVFSRNRLVHLDKRGRVLYVLN